MIIQCMLLFTLGVNFVPIIYFFLNFPFFLFDFHSYFGMGENGSIYSKNTKKNNNFYF